MDSKLKLHYFEECCLSLNSCVLLVDYSVYAHNSEKRESRIQQPRKLVSHKKTVNKIGKHMKQQPNTYDAIVFFEE